MNNQGATDRTSESNAYHVPVLLKESVEGLELKDGGVYVDVTFGGGGHSREIFKKLTSGKLVAFDQDPDALKNKEGFESDANRSFVFVPANFRHLKRFLQFYKIDKVDGVLADLGVSSHQFDTGSRGFSTRFDGLLDMRMDQKRGQTAAKIIAEYGEKELVHMFSYYGDIRNARTLSKALIQARQSSSIETTAALKEVAGTVAPKGKTSKYLAQIFQAIRIEVNEEMSALEEMLVQAVDVLKPGGKLVVISYHSLEDRLVKNLINSGNLKGKVEKDFYGNQLRPMDPVNRKPMIPSEAEIKINSRARSAKLRIAKKR